MLQAIRRRFRLGPPSIPATVFIALLVFIPFGLQQPLLNSDGDLARHLSHGRYMLEHGTLIHHDPFSFTRPGAPFVGFEYGSQLLYTLAERVGGLPAVAILAGLLIATAYGLVARFMLRRGVDPLLAYITTVLAALVGAGHWLARPHLFTYVAVLILLELLERKTRNPSQPFLPFFVVFVVWANLHGGFLYGWILIALYLVGSAVEIFVGGGDRHYWEFRTRYYAIALGAAVLGTLLTPHGIDLYRHMVAFLNQPYLFDNTQEFTSPNFHEGGAKLFLGALMVTLAALGLERSRPTLPRLLVITAGVYFALTAVRNMSLFGLTALPLLALHMDRVWRDLPDIRGIRGRFEATAIRTATFTWAVPAALLMLGLAFAHGRLGSAKLIADRFDATVFPRAAVERAKSARLEGRMFGEFTWNAYVEYAWPEQKIFIDGGTDFFGEELFREYSTIKSLGAGWRDLLKKWDISTLLLLRQSPLAREASRDGRWATWYCDSLAVVFRHAEAPRPMLPAQADSAERAMTTCGGTVSAPPPRPRRSEP